MLIGKSVVSPSYNGLKSYLAIIRYKPLLANNIFHGGTGLMHRSRGKEGGDADGRGRRWVERPLASRRHPQTAVKAGGGGGGGGIGVRDLGFVDLEVL